MGLADIKNDVVGTIDNVGALFGFGSHPYPDKDSSVKLPLVTNVKVDENDQAWRKSLGYGFKVVRVNKNGKIKDAEGWTDFILQINPQELTQDEVFAIEVTPTFSGVLVEHQGITIKDITISGTTGLSPKRRGPAGAYPQSGAPAFGTAGRSGYYEFQELRSYFRVYVEQKRNDPQADQGELRMIWQNFKDHEDLFVVPQKFTMTRSASKAHLYDYTINMKAIGIAEMEETGSWYDLTNIDNFIEDINDALIAGTKILEGGLSFLERIERDIRNTIIEPVREVAQFTQDWRASGGRYMALRERAETLSLANIKELFENTVRVSENVNDFIGRDMDAYNAAKGRIPTLPGSEDRTTADEELEIVNSLKKIGKALWLMQVDNKMFEPSTDDFSDQVEETYNEAKYVEQKRANQKELESKRAEEDSLRVTGDIVAANALAEEIEELEQTETQKLSESSAKLALLKTKTARIVKIDDGDNIQILAGRHLDSVDRYKELIILNGLNPPYVDTTPIEEDPVRVAGVLRPGDQIYIPQSGLPSDLRGAAKNRDYPITEGLSEAQKNFGVDIQLTDEFDLAVSNTQDLKLIAGSDNVGQAIVVKLLLDVGALKRHPEIGTDLQIGRKTTVAQRTVGQIRSTLFADSRIESIIYVSVRQEGNATIPELSLRLKGIDQPVAFPVPLVA